MNCPTCGKDIRITRIGTVDEEQECSSCGYYHSVATGSVRPFEPSHTGIGIAIWAGAALIIILAAFAVFNSVSKRPLVTTIMTDTDGKCWEMTMRSGDDLRGRYSPIRSIVSVPCPDKLVEREK